MHEVREGIIIPGFLPKIKPVYMNRAGSSIEIGKENLKFEVSALGAWSRKYDGILKCANRVEAP